MFLGRIVTKNTRTIDTLDYVDVTTKSDVIDNTIPTLIIGKKYAESIFGADKVKVLNKTIDKNITWTFAKTERRNEFERDLKKYNDNLFKLLSKSIKYTYFNIFIENFSRIKAFISFLNSDKLKVIYKDNKHLYIYCSNCVIGFSLTDTEYIGIDSEKIINRIKSNPNNILIENDNFLSKKTKIFLKNYKYITPYLYFLSKT